MQIILLKANSMDSRAQTNSNFSIQIIILLVFKRIFRIFFSLEEVVKWQYSDKITIILVE